MNLSSKKWLAALPLIVAVIGAVYLYRQADTQASFLGLPTVPCLDSTKPILQNYTLTVSISVEGRPYPLSPAIGHDPGNCLRAIHTEDGSGRIYVETNDTNRYTLGNFFQTWRTTFNQNQIAGYAVTAGHTLQVTVDGDPVPTYASTPLTPSSTIDVIYR